MPFYPIPLRETGRARQVYDVLRKKYVSLTPEEWVRQHFVWYLIEERGIPASWCVVESKLVFNSMTCRSDILVRNRQGEPAMVVECKAPSVKLSERVIGQVVKYNWTLKARYVVITNGLRHIACSLDYESKSWSFLSEIPGKDDL